MEAKWPLLDDYQAPYKEPLIAPTTNTITNGIISILPPPPNYNRSPRHIFSPSVKMTTPKPVFNLAYNTAKPATSALIHANVAPLPANSANLASGFQASKPLGFVPVTPTWLQQKSTTTPKPLLKSRYPFSNGPLLTQLQRPIYTQRRPSQMTVKHGIIPILKSRYRPPDLFRRIINYY